jgi:hypothetical protein
MKYNQDKTVWVYIAIYFENIDLSQFDIYNDVKVNISWPNNGLSSRLGLGGWKYQNLIPEDVPDVPPRDVFDAAYATDQLPGNSPFICYYNGYDYGLLDYDISQGHIIFKRVSFTLEYHDPAGWYDVNVRIQGDANYEDQTNYFEYVLGIGV